MARTKERPRPKDRVITWTRFYLPLDQEWPTWPTYEDMHVGPLTDVKDVGEVLLGRVVDNPEQAAYIIRESHRHTNVNYCIFSDRPVFENQIGMTWMA